MRIIAADGLDGVGKTTYVKKLYYAITEYNKELGYPYVIRFVHFPRYESETGIKIKEMLNSKEFALMDLIKLFAEDRALFWKEQKAEGAMRDRDVYIFDRYRFSNLLLNVTKFLDKMDLQVAMRKILQFDEDLENPKENHLILPTCSYNVRMQRLLDKGETDNNEQNDIWNLFNSAIYPRLVLEYTRTFLFAESLTHVFRTDLDLPSWARNLYDQMTIAEGINCVGFPYEAKYNDGPRSLRHFNFQHLRLNLFSAGQFDRYELDNGVQEDLLWQYIQAPDDLLVRARISDAMYKPES